MNALNVGSKRRFQLVLIKPSHYGDDGYVIRWWRSMVPSNSLASIYGIAADSAARQALGADVDIDIEAIDEFNTRVDIPKLLRRFSNNKNFGLVALVGVQSNQYPRALDIARRFRNANIPVAIGGFHVSGCLSMLDGGYADESMTHVTDEDVHNLDLLNQTSSAKDAVAHQKKVFELTRGTA